MPPRCIATSLSNQVDRELTSPEDETTFPSNGEVLFDGTSWDMDNDPLTFKWTSTIDGDLFASAPVQDFIGTHCRRERRLR